MNHMIKVWPDGRGHWYQITDTRTGKVVRQTWGRGSAVAAMREAEQVVEGLEFIEAMASSQRGAA